MATGRVDVLRRGSLSNPRKEFEYRDNCVRGAKARFFQHRGFEHKNGYQLSVGAPNSGYWKNGLYGKMEERGFGGMSKADKAHVKDCESSDFEDAVGLPPEKKRKFSPIIWNREEKEVKISSKNRVVPVAPLPPPQQSPTTSVNQVLEVVSDGEVSELQVLESGNQFQEKRELSIAESAVTDGLVVISQSKYLDDLSPPLLAEQQDQISVRMEVEELVQAPNISTSRWASDIDSPRDVSDDECSIDNQNTSPESGEFRREYSVGSRKRVFSSNEEDFFLGSGSGDKYFERELTGDEQDCENAGIDRVESDIEYHDLYSMEEPTVSNRRQFNMLQSCRSVFEFEKLNKINEGTYGVVYKAKDKKTGEIVALKKVKMDIDRDGDGFPLSSLREINILLSFSHPSVVNVKEVVMGDLDSIFMVMEYMEYDLKGLMEVMNQPFSISEVKWLMLQLLEGVEYLHENWVLHRDLKTSNILLNKEGELKICDFGLSRQYGSPLKPYTPLVVTLWYRAPEILLGTKQYSTAIDMWSVGCIMAEMVAKEALFRGKTEVDQLEKIFKTLGTPNETVWPGFSKLPGAKAKFVKQPYNLLRKKFPAASFTGSPVLSDLGFDLLSRLLSYDPEKRITAKDALKHDWFCEAPFPKSSFKPTLHELHGQKRYFNSRQHEKLLQR